MLESLSVVYVLLVMPVWDFNLLRALVRNVIKGDHNYRIWGMNSSKFSMAFRLIVTRCVLYYMYIVVDF